MVGYASFLEKGLMVRRIGFFDEGPIIIYDEQKVSHRVYWKGEGPHSHDSFQAQLFHRWKIALLRECTSVYTFRHFCKVDRQL